MNDLTPKGRALVEVARLDGPTSGERARMRAGIAARLALAAAGAAAVAGTASKVGAVANAAAVAPTAAASGGAVAGGAVAGGAAATFTFGKTIAIAALVGATTFAGGVVAGRRSVGPVEPAPVTTSVAAVRLTTSEARPRADAPVVREPSLLPAEASPASGAHPSAATGPSGEATLARRVARAPSDFLAAPVEAIARPDREVRSGEAAEPARARSSLAAENALLDEAQRALGVGDADAALRTLDAMAQQYPDGRMGEERRATRILALCAAGRVDAARGEAEIFARESPRSVLAERVRSSCAGGGEASAGSPQ